MMPFKAFFLGAMVLSGTLVVASGDTNPLSQERKTAMAKQATSELSPQDGDADTVLGLMKVPSPRSTAKTVERFEAILKEKGIRLFARIDHAEGAAKVKLTLRPTTLLIFGNPQAGTPLMQSKQTIGIDLPLRVLIWEDENGKTWLAYNQPDYLAKRHEIRDRDEAVKAMTSVLKSLAEAATAP